MIISCSPSYIFNGDNLTLSSSQCGHCIVCPAASSIVIECQVEVLQTGYNTRNRSDRDVHRRLWLITLNIQVEAALTITLYHESLSLQVEVEETFGHYNGVVATSGYFIIEADNYLLDNIIPVIFLIGRNYVGHIGRSSHHIAHFVENFDFAHPCRLDSFRIAKLDGLDALNGAAINGINHFRNWQVELGITINSDVRSVSFTIVALDYQSVHVFSQDTHTNRCVLGHHPFRYLNGCGLVVFAHAYCTIHSVTHSK